MREVNAAPRPDRPGNPAGRIDNPATVTVVTGPAGHDIGSAAAWLGRDLGDGLAIRTVQPDRLRKRTSPTPARCITATADLFALPSAWQNPDTNLGVAVGGFASVDLLDSIRDDLATLERIGLNPAHRLTVQGIGPARHIWPGVEHAGPNGLAVAARDSVLRAAAGTSRQVLIEAGDGQTLLDALHTVGLPPWSPHIDRLNLLLVLDVAQLVDGGRNLVDVVAVRAAPFVAGQGGGTNRRGQRLGALTLVLENFQLLAPAVAGLDSEAFRRHPDEGGPVTDEQSDVVGEIVAAIEHDAGVFIVALGTGPAADGRRRYIDVTVNPG